MKVWSLALWYCRVVLTIRKWCPAPCVVAHTYDPALRRQKEVDLCEFKAILVYIKSSRPARAT